MIEVASCPSIVITAGTKATVEGETVVIERPGAMMTRQMVGPQATAVASKINDEVAIFENEIAGSIGGKPNRGEPNHGEPNRGTPNRDEPNRGR